MASKKNRVPTLELGTVTSWPLDQLAISPLNVRKNVSMDDGSIDELAADIGAKGLLQSLIVHPGPAGPEDKGRLVVGGQRRFIALLRLVALGVLAKDAAVPVRDVPEELAIEVSLAENLQRKDMNPADEAQAFAALIETGRYDAREIAKRFGYDEKFVKRRVKIAGLAEPVFEALRSGKITINAAEAYALADTQDLQLRVFKARDKDSWRGHEVSSILSEIRHSGIAADSPVAKFIGGMKAYKAAGGVAEIDDAYQPLLFKDPKDAKNELRMRDGGVVGQLILDAKVKHAAAAFKVATTAYPFVTGFLWASPLEVGNWSDGCEKPDKKSGLVVVKPGWNGTTNLEAADIRKRVKKAAEKHSGVVWAVVGVDKDGKLTVSERVFAVGKDAWTCTEPKKDAGSRSSGGMTEEERQAHNRKIEIQGWQRRLFGRSLVGATPGFGITDCSFDRRNQRITIDLIMNDPAPEGSTYSRDQWNTDLSPEVLAPFLDEATAKVEELEAERREREEAEELKAKAHAVERVAMLDNLELTPLDKWPAVVTITLVDHGVDYQIQRKTVDGVPVLECFGVDGEEWESDNVLETVQLIRDAVAENDWAIEIVQEMPEPAPLSEAAQDPDSAPAAEVEAEAQLENS